MSERSNNVVGLGKVRKARERDLRKAVAEENAVKFGRTKAQKVLEATQSEQARKMLDNNRIEEE
ncbi:MAG: DUF4169 family protein [Dinoroseobacter sp.]|nr:DUF4169 family protein [Dinoroseobacter sp.]